MFEKRSCQFKIETLWQELVNRHIQEIQVSLKEIKFFNRSRSLCAKGSIRRTILYTDFDGRFKKLEDRLQFEVTLGAALVEPLPLLAADLQQDYYLFQPNPKRNSEVAVLETGFSLTVYEINPVNQVDYEQEQIILVDSIIEKDSAEYLINHLIRFPNADARPKKFCGEVIFFQEKSYLVNGEVKGAVEYLSKDKIKREISLTIPFSISLKLAPFPQETAIKISGEVIDYYFHQISSCQWQLEIRIRYNWCLLKKEELPCAKAKPDPQLNCHPEILNILSLTPVFNKTVSLTKQLMLPFSNNKIVELNVKLRHYKDQPLKRGILLSLALEVEAFYIDAATGREAFQRWEVNYDEFLNDIDFNFNEAIKIFSEILPKQSRFFIQEQQLNVFFTIDYQAKIYRQEVLPLLKDEQGKLIQALIATAQKEFNFIKETSITLKRKVVKINTVKSQLNNLIYQPKDGWLRVESELIIVVNYCGFRKKVYEETFKRKFVENLTWGELTNQNILQLESQMVHETYELKEKQLIHQALIKLAAHSFLETETTVKLKTEKSDNDTPVHSFFSNNKQPQPTNILKLTLEQELPLQLGNPREIVDWRSFISTFSCRSAQRALLIEGTFGSDLEYWDEDGFLRKEYLEFPFWNFIDTNLNNSEQRFVPQINNTKFTPLTKWPWQRGTVKITVELVLNPLIQEKHSKS